MSQTVNIVSINVMEIVEAVSVQTLAERNLQSNLKIVLSMAGKEGKAVNEPNLSVTGDCNILY